MTKLLLRLLIILVAVSLCSCRLHSHDARLLWLVSQYEIKTPGGVCCKFLMEGQYCRKTVFLCGLFCHSFGHLAHFIPELVEASDLQLKAPQPGQHLHRPPTLQTQLSLKTENYLSPPIISPQWLVVKAGFPHSDSAVDISLPLCNRVLKGFQFRMEIFKTASSNFISASQIVSLNSNEGRQHYGLWLECDLC